MLIGISILIGLICIVGFLFLNFSPQFGGKATDIQKQLYAKSPNYKDGKFFNLKGVKMEMSAKDGWKATVGMFKSVPKARPESGLPVQKIDSTSIADYNSPTRFVWFGHSAFLLQMNDKNILIDPMFSAVPAPHPWLGPKRFSAELPIAIEQLPKVDAVLISHDHYDHLDYVSISKLKDKVDRFFVPLGLGSHLTKWGVDPNRITELDWWKDFQFEDLKFISTPAQHFSGRGLTDRDRTLWCSWIIQSDTEKIFFSGDSGYNTHFKEIGKRHGPFDFAMIECGQYNKLWPEVHMFPEETAQAGVDLMAEKIMPIHWGAFKLAHHSWVDPIERVSIKAKELQIKLVTPEIGVPTLVKDTNVTYSAWWNNY